MDYVGKSAHTDHGLGTITEVETIRGRSSFRVAGNGFNVWVPETRLRLANSMGYEAGLETTIEQGDTHSYPVTYPYDPSPQYPVDLFRKEQTILPGDYEIDPEDRLHPSDEDGKRVSPNRPYPGPAPDLFAKGAGKHDQHFWKGLTAPAAPSYVVQDSHDWLASHPEGEQEPMGPRHQAVVSDLPLPHSREYDHPSVKWAPDGKSYHYRGQHVSYDPLNEVDYDHGPPHLSSYHYADDEDAFANPIDKEWGEDEWHSDLPDGPERTFDAAYRPAGLSDRYASIPDEVDERNPITAFRADPLGFMQRRAYAMTAGEDEHLTQKFADYDNLIEASAKMRTAAWTDVRNKAQRLRHEGKVQINHVTPQHIYATVNGDNGTYDTMIVKGASGAFSGGQSIANWYCDCDWGKWAFKRKYSYVGRLCSHAYAAYLDMQSHTHKDNGGRFKAASIVDDFKSWAKENNDGHMDRGSMTDFINTCEKRVTKEEAEELYDYLLKNTQVAPERDYDIPYTFDNEEAYKTAADADALRQRPLSLTPDLRVVPKNDENEWTDVTEDDRKTTGPDQIVHFGAIASTLHTADGFGDPNMNPADPKAWGGEFLNGILHPDQLPGWGAGKKYLDSHPGPLRDAPGGGGQAQPVSDVTKTPQGAGGFGNWDKFNDMAKSKGLVNDQGQVQGGPAVTPSTPNPYSTVTTNGAGGAPPAGPAAPAGAKPSNPTWFPKQESTTTNLDPNSPWTPNQNKTDLKGNSYQIQRGDTLHDIAQRSGLDVNDIAKANNIQDINKINTGDTLKLPGENRTPGGAGAGGKLPSDATFNALGESADALNDQGKPNAPAPGAPGAGKLPSNDTFNALNEGADALGVKDPTPSLAGGGASQAAGGTKPIAPGSPADLKTPQPPVPPTAPGIPKTQSKKSFAHLLHHAADDNDDDDQRPDTGEAAAKLDRLRELGEQDPSDHYQHMDDYNDEVRNLVEELNDAGVDAMPFVANRFAAPQGQRKDNDPSDGDANFAGQSNPNWADEPFNGSGPDPQLWSSDSASWVDEHERPDFTDVTDLPDGDIIKFNDSRSKPQQGPRHSHRLHADMDGGSTIGDFSNINGLGSGASTDPLANGGQQVGEGTVASRHYADDDSGYFNPNNPSAHDWEEGSGDPFMDEVGHAVDQASPLHGVAGGDAGEEGGAEGLAEEAPELLALASRQSTPNGGFSLEAFDRGEFSFDDAGGAGELRRANRIGGGPRQEIRVDHGARGWQKEAQTYDLPDDFGNNGDPDLASYSGDAGADPTGADVVASFQRSAGALEMVYGQGGNAPRQGSLDDFSSSPMVQKMLRTAGRVFTPAEQAELENETHVLGARNMPTEQDLAGTHYLL